MPKLNKELIEHGVKCILEGIGDNMARDGLIDTPKRVAKMYEDILNGYDEGEDINELARIFEERTDDMVTVTNVPFYSFCEHHLLPFIGKLHIAYLPSGDRILGISKLVRIARIYAKRPQVQERLTREIADALESLVPNKGVAVRIEAEHMCMSIRGVRTPGAKTITTRLTGLFKEDEKARFEFIEAVRCGN